MANDQTSNQEKREFKKGTKVKLHIYFPTGYWTDDNGNKYYDFVNYPSEDKYPKAFIIKRMQERIVNKMLKGKHTGGQYYDMETGERIGEVSSTGSLTETM